MYFVEGYYPLRVFSGAIYGHTAGSNYTVGSCTHLVTLCVRSRLRHNVSFPLDVACIRRESNPARGTALADSNSIDPCG
jgi:hypothetical protein